MAVLLSAVLGGALGCGSTCLGAWFSGSFGPVLWLGALAGAVTAAEICILAGGIRVNALPGGANYCLGVSLLMFVIATTFCTRPRDKLLH